MSLAEITFLGPGRAIKQVEHEYAGPVTAEDVALLNAPRAIKPNPVAKMRHRHHELARALASGVTPAQASVMTGYDPSHISNLQNNPAFQALVADYAAGEEAVFADARERMAAVLIETSAIIHEKLENEGTDIPMETLESLLKTTADRTGFAPVSKSQNTVVTIDLSEAMRNARKKLKEPVTVEGKAVAR